MFIVNRREDEARAMNSPRNLSINQFLLELDGMISNLGEKILKDKEDKKTFIGRFKGINLKVGKEKLEELKKVT